MLGLEGPVCASWREILLWSIETHSQAQQLQINFLCCGQTHPRETQRSPRAGLKLCLVHGRGKFWDSLSSEFSISLTTEMPVSNSRTWDQGKQTQHVTCWLDVHTLAILPAITASLLSPRLPHKSHTAAGLTGCFVADTAATKSLGQQEGKRQTNRSAFPSFRHSL